MGREESAAETALEKDAGSKLGMRGASMARYASEAPVQVARMVLAQMSRLPSELGGRLPLLLRCIVRPFDSMDGRGVACGIPNTVSIRLHHGYALRAGEILAIVVRSYVLLGRSQRQSAIEEPTYKNGDIEVRAQGKTVG